jgi:acyl phosphate:glycerol-3-phosphate acyltransferase
MDRLLQLAFAIALSYAIGTWTAGYYLTRWRTGRDIRELGSGSAGARNAARVLGRSFGVAAFAWDFAKGASAVLLAAHLLPDEPAPRLAAAAVVLGHVWPVQLGFRGGKGVAPAAGALAVLQPAVLATMAAVYALGAIVARGVARRALAAFAAGAASIPFLDMQAGDAAACFLVLAILIWTHRDGLPSRKNNVSKAEE